jgi:hypothetical protein
VPTGSNTPGVYTTAFECRHCGAYSPQQWYWVFASRLKDGQPPHVPGADWPRLVNQADQHDGAAKGHDNANHSLLQVENVLVSACFVCHRPSIWVNDSVIFPPLRRGPQPHADMSEDIQRDFEEARGIAASSARSAAALLRLCIQKLCDEFGEKDKKIDDAISGLVAKGLDPMIQQALDSVRVIGNEAVHPGQMDLRDDDETAAQLFGLVNLIVDHMISHPKKVSGDLCERAGEQAQGD